MVIFHSYVKLPEGRISDRMPDSMPEHTPEHMAERVPDKIPERVLWSAICSKVPGTVLPNRPGVSDLNCLGFQTHVCWISFSTVGQGTYQFLMHAGHLRIAAGHQNLYCSYSHGIPVTRHSNGHTTSNHHFWFCLMISHAFPIQRFTYPLVNVYKKLWHITIFNR